MTKLFQIPAAPMHLVKMPDGQMKLCTPPPMVAVPPRDGVQFYASRNQTDIGTASRGQRGLSTA
jgi:hypothetical protein